VTSPTTDLPEQDHDVGAVLRVKSFRRLWLALAGSSFGDWMGLLATTAMAYDLAGGSYAEENLAVAGVLILRLAPAVILGPLAGLVADRLNRRFVMVFGDVLRGVLFISIAVVGTLQWLFVATVLIEILALFWGPAKDATVPNLVPRNRLETANQMSLAVTYGTAPLAALFFSGISLLNGVLDNFLERFYTNPIDFALYVNAATFIISGLVIAGLPIPKREKGAGAGQQSAMREILDGWTFIGRTPLVRGLVIGMLGAFAAAGFVIGLARTYVQDLGGGQPAFGALFAAVFFGLALGMWLGPRVLSGFSRFRLFGLSLITAGCFLMALALVPNIVIAFLFTMGMGAGGGVAWVTGFTLLGLTVDDTVRGRTFAFLGSASRIVLVSVLAAGPALAALIGEHEIEFTEYAHLTYNGAAFVLMLAAVLAIGLGVIAYRQMDDRPGSSLVHDVRQWWARRKDTPAAPARRSYDGVFLAIEGGDGTGKSTQARLLADWLREDQGHDVVLTREPGATALGLQLRQVLLGTGASLGARAEALLFAADRAQHVEEMVRPALTRGEIVVTDRYIDSSVAYQGAGRDLDGDEVVRISRWATEGLVPDLTVLLDVDPLISRARRARDAARDGEDRLEVLPDEFHDRVRSRFLDLARSEPHRYVVIDAGLRPDEIQDVIRRHVREVLPLSARRRHQLKERLAEEEQTRARRAAAEAEVLQMDADLKARRMQEAREREESRRRAREEAERQLQEEAERELRAAEGSNRREQTDRRAAQAAADALGPPTEKLPVVPDGPAPGAETIDRATPPSRPPRAPRKRVAPSPVAERAAAAAVRAGEDDGAPEANR
jgi:dTMP kinase